MSSVAVHHVPEVMRFPSLAENPNPIDEVRRSGKGGIVREVFLRLHTDHRSSAIREVPRSGKHGEHLIGLQSSPDLASCDLEHGNSVITDLMETTGDVSDFRIFLHDGNRTFVELSSLLVEVIVGGHEMDVIPGRQKNAFVVGIDMADLLLVLDQNDPDVFQLFVLPKHIPGVIRAPIVDQNQLFRNQGLPENGINGLSDESPVVMAAQKRRDFRADLVKRKVLDFRGDGHDLDQNKSPNALIALNFHDLVFIDLSHVAGTLLPFLESYDAVSSAS